MFDKFPHWRRMRGDRDPDGPPACPFCGRDVERDATLLYCDDCEAVWHSEDEIERDREQPSDPLDWTDVFTEDR